MGLLDRGDRDQDAASRSTCMRRAGLVVGETLELLRGTSAPASRPASSTRSPRTTSARSGATPSFLGYHGFPGSICASVNDEVVHGIPGDRVLADGDVVSIDCGAIVDGWHGDAAITVAVGDGPRRRDRADAGHRGVAVARHRRRAPRRPGHRHLPRGRAPRPRARAPTASSRTTPATASAPRCTSRPTCPTTAARAGAPAGRGPGAGRRADGHPRHQGDRRCSRTTGPSSPPTAAGPPTSSTPSPSPPQGTWVLTALDGGEAAAHRARRPVRRSLTAV